MKEKQEIAAKQEITVAVKPPQTRSASLPVKKKKPPKSIGKQEPPLATISW